MEVKLLLLGAGESGKSTVLKQMQIIHAPEDEPAFSKYDLDTIWAPRVHQLSDHACLHFHEQIYPSSF